MMNSMTKLPAVPLLTGRQDLILARATGKRVLHLGCVDAGLLHQRFARQELMHQKLAAVASELWGVDIDQEGIAFLAAQGFGHLIAGDICEPPILAQLSGQPFDLILATEVIEHLPNPVQFLQAARHLLTPGQTELIITVPNAFRIETLLWLLRGIEYVHPDHNYWFSYVTATNLLRKSGLQVTEVFAYSFQPRAGLPNVARRILRRSAPPAPAPAAAPPRAVNGVSPHLLVRGLDYVRSLPKRVLASALYRTTPFWGDGLILVAQAPAHAD